MKDPMKRWAGGASIRMGAVIGFLFTVLALQGPAETISSKNSVISFDLSGPGMTSWTVDGQNQLAQQWFWFRTGNSAEAPINNISAPSLVTYIPTLGKLTVSYANADYSVKVAYQLTGNTVGTGKSSLSEQITIANTTSSTLDFHFFQYSDFNLLNSTPGQSINFLGSPTRAIQLLGSVGLTNSVTPSVSHQQAAANGDILTSLMDGSATTLTDNSGILAGSGDANYAFEWDFSINPGSTADIISAATQIQIPEPSGPALACIGLGLAALTVCRRRRV